MPKLISSVLLCALVMSASLSSCLARGGVRGELRTHLDVNLAAFYTAALKTLEMEGLTIKSDASDNTTALIKAHYADETPLTIHCTLLTQSAMSVTIQIGLFGDRPRSEALLKDILQGVTQAHSNARSNTPTKTDAKPQTNPPQKAQSGAANGLEQVPNKNTDPDLSDSSQKEL